MKRYISRQEIALVAIPFVILVLAWYFVLLQQGPTFRGKCASQWSAAMKRGETVFGYPVNEQGMSIPRYSPNCGSWSFSFRRLRYMVLGPRVVCDPALKQISRGPDGAWYAGRDVDPAAGPVLIELLNEDEEKVRNEAAFALSVIGDRADTSAAIPGLMAMLNGSRADRLNAALALGQFGPRASAAIPALVEASESADPDVRKVANDALGGIQPDS